jgi:SNF2 family DNA or RNA helicase
MTIKTPQPFLYTRAFSTSGPRFSGIVASQNRDDSRPGVIKLKPGDAARNTLQTLLDSHKDFVTHAALVPERMLEAVSQVDLTIADPTARYTIPHSLPKGTFHDSVQQLVHHVAFDQHPLNAHQKPLRYTPEQYLELHTELLTPVKQGQSYYTDLYPRYKIASSVISNNTEIDLLTPEAFQNLVTMATRNVVPWVDLEQRINALGLETSARKILIDVLVGFPTAERLTGGLDAEFKKNPTPPLNDIRRAVKHSLYAAKKFPTEETSFPELLEAKKLYQTLSSDVSSCTTGQNLQQDEALKLLLKHGAVVLIKDPKNPNQKQIVKTSSLPPVHPELRKYSSSKNDDPVTSYWRSLFSLNFVPPELDANIILSPDEVFRYTPTMSPLGRSSAVIDFKGSTLPRETGLANDSLLSIDILMGLLNVLPPTEPTLLDVTRYIVQKIVASNQTHQKTSTHAKELSRLPQELAEAYSSNNSKKKEALFKQLADLAASTITGQGAHHLAETYITTLIQAGVMTADFKITPTAMTPQAQAFLFKHQFALSTQKKLRLVIEPPVAEELAQAAPSTAAWYWHVPSEKPFQKEAYYAIPSDKAIPPYASERDEAFGFDFRERTRQQLSALMDKIETAEGFRDLSEELKTKLRRCWVPTTGVLAPQILSLNDDEREALSVHHDEFAQLGIELLVQDRTSNQGVANTSSRFNPTIPSYRGGEIQLDSLPFTSPNTTYTPVTTKLLIQEHSENNPLFALSQAEEVAEASMAKASSLLESSRSFEEIPAKKAAQNFGKGTVTLYPYQEKALGVIEHLREKKKGLVLADDVGAGKTLVAAAAIQEKINACHDHNTQTGPILVLAPTTEILTQWKNVLDDTLDFHKDSPSFQEAYCDNYGHLISEPVVFWNRTKNQRAIDQKPTLSADNFDRNWKEKGFKNKQVILMTYSALVQMQKAYYKKNNIDNPSETQKNECHASIVESLNLSGIIADEAHSLRNDSTATFQAASAVSEAIGNRDLYRLPGVTQSTSDLNPLLLDLTATPFVNNLEDIASLLYFADPKAHTKALEEAFKAAATELKGIETKIIAAQQSLLANTASAQVKIKRDIAILEQQRTTLLSAFCEKHLNGRVMKRSLSSVMPELGAAMPKRGVVQVLSPELDEVQAQHYEAALRKNAQARREIQAQGTQADREKKASATGMNLVHELQKICDSVDLAQSSIQEAGSGGVTPLQAQHISPKMLETLRLVKEARERGEKTVVFVEYKAMGDLLANYLNKELKEPNAACTYFGGASYSDKDTHPLNRFADKSDVLITTYQKGGEGLNLQHANNIICYNNRWTAAQQFIQAIGRCFRLGQQKAVNVTFFASRLKGVKQPTVEGQKLLVAAAKGQNAQNALKEEDTVGNMFMGPIIQQAPSILRGLPTA